MLHFSGWQLTVDVNQFHGYTESYLNTTYIAVPTFTQINGKNLGVFRLLISGFNHYPVVSLPTVFILHQDSNLVIVFTCQDFLFLSSQRVTILSRSRFPNLLQLKKTITKVLAANEIDIDLRTVDQSDWCEYDPNVDASGLRRKLRRLSSYDY